jgi:hypothetical protein
MTTTTTTTDLYPTRRRTIEENKLGNVEFKEWPNSSDRATGKSRRSSWLEINIPHGSLHSVHGWSNRSTLTLWDMTVDDYAALRDECNRAIGVLTTCSEGVSE